MTTIHIIRHASYDQENIVGVFTGEQEARRSAFDYAAHHFGIGVHISVITYSGDGVELDHASVWSVPMPPTEPELPQGYQAMQRQHEKALEEHKKDLAAYEGIKKKFERPE